MGERFETLLTALGFMGVLVAVLFFLNFIDEEKTTLVASSPVPTATSAVETTPEHNADAVVAAPPSPKKEESPRAVTAPKKASVEPKKEVVQKRTTTTIAHEEPLYPFPVIPFDNINVSTRAALVNIMCMPRGGTFRPISGSGVLIDPRGIILTNAHVAQYILLSESTKVDLACTIRSGTPAVAHWKAEVLYMPSVWVDEHAKDLNAERPRSTGEHDYALLRITSRVDGSSIASPLPFIPIDTRDKLEFPGDPVLVAGYPAEFIGGIAASSNLYPVSSVTTIKQLLTFETGSVDLFSVGGVIEAQGGSSGGAVVNSWNYLLGIITTTSEGATTADRDLRIITLDYINRDMLVQTGGSIGEKISGDVAQKSLDFQTEVAPALIEKFLAKISH